MRASASTISRAALSVSSATTTCTSGTALASRAAQLRVMADCGGSITNLQRFDTDIGHNPRGGGDESIARGGPSGHASLPAVWPRHLLAHDKQARFHTRSAPRTRGAPWRNSTAARCAECNHPFSVAPRACRVRYHEGRSSLGLTRPATPGRWGRDARTRLVRGEWAGQAPAMTRSACPAAACELCVTSCWPGVRQHATAARSSPATTKASTAAPPARARQ